MVNPAVCGSELAGVDDRTVFEFDPAVLNETSFSYDDFYFIAFRLQHRALTRTIWWTSMMSGQIQLKRGEKALSKQSVKRIYLQNVSYLDGLLCINDFP